MPEDRAAFRLRVLSALTLVPIALGVVLAGGWVYPLFVALLAVLMALEWRRLSDARFDAQYGRLAGGIALGVGLVATTLAALDRPREAVACVGLGMVVAAVLAGTRAAASLWAAVGVALIGLPTIALVWLRSVPEARLRPGAMAADRRVDHRHRCVSGRTARRRAAPGALDQSG